MKWARRHFEVGQTGRPARQGQEKFLVGGPSPARKADQGPRGRGSGGGVVSVSEFRQILFQAESALTESASNKA